MKIDRHRGTAVSADILGRGLEFAPAIVAKSGSAPTWTPHCQPELNQFRKVGFPGGGSGTREHHVGSILVLGPHRPIDRGIRRVRQHLDGPTHRTFKRLRDVGPGHKDRIVGAGHPNRLVERPNVVGKPIDELDPGRGANRVNHTLIDVVAPDGQHQVGLGHFDALEEPRPKITPR